MLFLSIPTTEAISNALAFGLLERLAFWSESAVENYKSPAPSKLEGEAAFELIMTIGFLHSIHPTLRLSIMDVVSLVTCEVHGMPVNRIAESIGMVPRRVADLIADLETLADDDLADSSGFSAIDLANNIVLRLVALELGVSWACPNKLALRWGTNYRSDKDLDLRHGQAMAEVEKAARKLIGSVDALIGAALFARTLELMLDKAAPAWLRRISELAETSRPFYSPSPSRPMPGLRLPI